MPSARGACPVPGCDARLRVLNDIRSHLNWQHSRAGPPRRQPVTDAQLDALGFHACPTCGTILASSRDAARKHKCEPVGTQTQTVASPEPTPAMPITTPTQSIASPSASPELGPPMHPSPLAPALGQLPLAPGADGPASVPTPDTHALADPADPEVQANVAILSGLAHSPSPLPAADVVAAAAPDSSPPPPPLIAPIAAPPAAPRLPATWDEKMELLSRLPSPGPLPVALNKDFVELMRRLGGAFRTNPSEENLFNIISAPK
ncbi:hypothetical protein OC842_006833, partial [Tilletia horrida]